MASACCICTTPATTPGSASSPDAGTRWRQHNLPVDETLMRRFDADKFSIHAVRDCLMELERDGLQFDAVLASEDVLAVGAMKYAQAVGRRVPENLSVVGYNNSNLACVPSRS